MTESFPAEAQHPYKKLSVIVPVYDERNTVAEIIRRAKTVELPLDREIVVVDDGSTDGTREVLSHLADSTVRVFMHTENRGKGRPSAPAWPRPRVTW
jgi:glycosyltransferase involved in cell wall biosynthesis